MKLEPPRIFGSTVFCDEIRQENTGKFIYMGVYSTDLVVHGPFPFTLPSFSMAIRYLEKRGECSGPVNLQIFLPGDDIETGEPSMGAEFPNMDEVRAQMLAALDSHPQRERQRFLLMATNMAFRDVVLKEPGDIRVRAVAGDDHIVIGSLRVSTAGEETVTIPIDS